MSPLTYLEAQQRIITLVLKPDLAALIQLRMDIGDAVVSARVRHIEGSAKALVPKDAQWTDFDRRTLLEAFMAEKEAELRQWELLLDIVTDLSKAQLHGGIHEDDTTK